MIRPAVPQSAVAGRRVVLRSGPVPGHAVDLGLLGVKLAVL